MRRRHVLLFLTIAMIAAVSAVPSAAAADASSPGSGANALAALALAVSVAVALVGTLAAGRLAFTRAL